MTQYVAVEFNKGGRTYTYHNDGEPVQVGDKVKVEVRNEGWKTVTVTEILPAKPKFETRAVVGKVVEEEEKTE